MKCYLCRVRTKTLICLACRDVLSILPPACKHCGTPLEGWEEDPVCITCRPRTPWVDRLWVHYVFEGMLRRLIHEFKYHEGYFLTSFLSSLMIQTLPKNYETDCFIPVPIHTRRLQTRGFHHTRLLATQLSRYYAKPLASNLITKLRHTPYQAHLSAQDRRQSQSELYEVKSHSYRKVTLVDDVVTTGQTLSSLAEVLKKTHGLSVDAVSVCKTLGFPAYTQRQ